MEIFLIVSIIIFITIVILNKYAKNKTSNEMMFLGIEFTIIGVAFMVFCIGTYANNNFLFIGLLVAIVGFIINIFGFSKK